MLNFTSQNIFIISELNTKPFKMTPKMNKPVGSTFCVYLYSIYLYYCQKCTLPAYSFNINVNFLIFFKTLINFISQNIFIISKLKIKPFKMTPKMNKPVGCTFGIYLYSGGKGRN